MKFWAKWSELNHSTFGGNPLAKPAMSWIESAHINEGKIYHDNVQVSHIFFPTYIFKIDIRDAPVNILIVSPLDGINQLQLVYKVGLLVLNMNSFTNGTTVVTLWECDSAVRYL